MNTNATVITMPKFADTRALSTTSWTADAARPAVEAAGAAVGAARGIKRGFPAWSPPV